MRRWLIGLFLLLAVVATIMPACAGVLLTPQKLAEMGIKYDRFAIINLTEKGDLLLASEKVADPKIVKEKGAYIFHIFRFAMGDLKEHKKVYIPIGEMQQACMNDEGTLALISADNGSKFLLLDLNKNKVDVIFDGKTQTPGFRCDGIIIYDDGYFYATGYMYDKDRFMTMVGLAKIDLSQKGSKLFSEGLNTIELEKKLGGKMVKFIYNSPKEGFFGTGKLGNIKLQAYSNGKVLPVDTGMTYSVLASGKHRIFYSVKKGDNAYELVLKDIAQNKRIVLSKNKPWEYLYLSSDGNIAIATLIDYAKKQMNFYWADEYNDYKLQTMKELTGVPFGVLRISGNGRYFAFLSKDGVLYSTIH